MTDISFQKTELEKMRIGCELKLSNEFHREIDVKVVEDYVYNRVSAMFKGYVWAEKDSVKKQEISYPATWKDALKERWFPKWLQKKYPVIYHKVVLDVKCLYPEFTPAVRNEEFRLMILRSDHDDRHSLHKQG
jgi:hypothetical protein